MGYVKGLKCRECGRPYPAKPLHVCEYCFGPLEVDYDYEAIGRIVNRRAIEAGPPNIWRYRPLLPIEGEAAVGRHCGFTPLVRARNLGKALGLTNLYVKNDTVNHPTLSFKDRVVAVAVIKALEFGFPVVACASTGNLANSVAAHAAEGGLTSFVFIPADLEQGKVLGTSIYAPNVVAVEGTYDEVNRLCSEVADKYGWAFVNINIRPYYAEGSKTFGYEIAEQLGWRAPDHIIVPAAGGSLITKVWKGLQEFHRLGLLPAVPTRMHVAQAEGCGPIVNAVKAGSEVIRPVKHPRTIAKSLAIGNPADGYYAFKVVKDSRGTGELATDEEIVESMKMLAATEGIFAETAGGVTLAATRKLVQHGVIGRDDVTVISVTGNGLKTQEAVAGALRVPTPIKPTLTSFDAALAQIPPVDGGSGPPRDSGLAAVR
ncbi:MAG: threonine synthase [candidate division NC10 bacterium]|nr:threonine synthase [candidate division NC10 bacterium]MBI2162604.1 threonine synthase [candidate division NC10 bacterium]MBI3086485.1 threonine synthase [candidate division NC10 bacterium]